MHVTLWSYRPGGSCGSCRCTAAAHACKKSLVGQPHELLSSSDDQKGNKQRTNWAAALTFSTSNACDYEDHSRAGQKV